MRIRNRLLLSFMILALLMMASVSIIGYTAVNSLETSNGENIDTVSEITMSSIRSDLENTYFDTKRIATNQDILEQVEKSNTEFENLDNMTETMEERETGWVEGGEIRTRILQNNMSKFLRREVNLRTSLFNREKENEMLLTNRYGGLIGASGNVSDYIQSDETWWKNAMNGSGYLAELRFDRSLGTYSIEFSVPLTNSRGEHIGVISNGIPLSVIIEPVIEQIAATKTGSNIQFHIVDRDGNIYYNSQNHSRDDPEAIRHIIDQLLSSDENFVLGESLENPELEEYYALSEIGIWEDRDWYLLIGQDLYNKTSNPIQENYSKTIDRMLLISFFTIIYALIVALLLSESIAKPIIRLKEILDNISKGDIYQKMDEKLKKQDNEIGALANSFDRLLTSFKIAINQNKNNEIDYDSNSDDQSPEYTP